MRRNPSASSWGSATTKTVYSEIEWGLDFRKKARKEREKAVRNCDDESRKRKKKAPNPCAKMDELFASLNADGRKIYADPFKVIQKEVKRAQKNSKCGSKKKCNKKSKIIDRDRLTRKQHIELLSRPRVLPQEPEVEKKPKRKRKKRCKCKMEDDSFLSPRMKQLALPKKRVVYSNWEIYQHVLNPDSVERMEDILNAGTGHNLEADEAAKYFKAEAKRRRKPRISKRQKKKENAEKKWLSNEINILADLIVHDIAKNPFPPEHNRHMQLTSALIATLRYKGYKIKPINRNTKSFRKRCVLEILDHISVWSDKIYTRAEVFDRKLNVMRYERMLASYMALAEAKKAPKPKCSLDVLNELLYAKDRDLIETFIKTLEAVSDKELEAIVHHERFADSTYYQLTEKLKSLRDPGIDAVTLKNLQMHSLEHEVQRWERKRAEQLGEDVRNAVAIIYECLQRFVKPLRKERRSSKEKDARKGSKQEQANKSSEGLENVDFSQVPEYRDPNEYMDKDDFVGRNEGDDEQEYFDRSLFNARDEEEEG